MQTSQIRQKFVEFYEAENYYLLPRAPLLDDSIPMSFVMSAGLVQVERSLSRSQTRDGDKYLLVQDCFRHFDIDKVGTDDFHLSVFEMPGAFKFGPIDKAETIKRMWQLATKILKIDKDRLWASYFKGGNILNNNEIPKDNIVCQTWIDVGLPAERVIGLGVKDNYWLQGKGINDEDIARKSGPNTELFYDRGLDKSCGSTCLPGCKCGRFVEFSNSLFICYEVNPKDGKFEYLADPFSETVIGVERVAMILQGCDSVFDTDSYKSILKAIQEFVKIDDVYLPWVKESKRVLADHLKALYLLVADNAPPPGKNGRERIIKLLIRGVMTRQMLLGISSQLFLPAVLSCLAAGMDADRSKAWIQERVLDYFSRQQKQFVSTVERGYALLEKSLEDNNGKTLSGSQIIHLEKKIGIPHLLIERKLKNTSLPYNQAVYEDALVHWKTT